MSRSYKNNSSVVPSWFKRLQMRSQKQKQNRKQNLKSPTDGSGFKYRKGSGLQVLQFFQSLLCCG